MSENSQNERPGSVESRFSERTHSCINLRQLLKGESIIADIQDSVLLLKVAINLLVECKGTERDVYKELLASLEEAQKAGKTKVTARFVKSKKVSVKPKVIRETFTSLLPASNQIRSQIERVKTDDTIGELHATTRNAAVTAATTGKMRMGFSLLYFC
ncbi:hypothetical protein ACP01F_004860 [Salmonella enterica]